MKVIDVINWYIWYDYALKGGQNALKVQLKIFSFLC